jgi:hypothetical protein
MMTAMAQSRAVPIEQRMPTHCITESACPNSMFEQKELNIPWIQVATFYRPEFTLNLAEEVLKNRAQPMGQVIR